MASTTHVENKQNTRDGDAIASPNAQTCPLPTPAFFQRTFGAISPTSRAILLASGTLFIAFIGLETERALSEAQHRLDLTTRILVSALSETHDESITDRLDSLSELLDNSIVVSLSPLDHDGTPLTSTQKLEAQSASAINLPTLSAQLATNDATSLITARQDITAVLAPIGLHMLFGCGAFLMLFAAKLSRHKTRLSTIIARPYLPHVLEGLPNAAACWSKHSGFIIANDRFAALLAEAQITLQAGMNYLDVLNSLFTQHSVTELKDDETGRIIQLKRSNGDVFLLQEYPIQSGGFITVLDDTTAQAQTEQHLIVLQDRLMQVSQSLETQKQDGHIAKHSKMRFLNGLNHELRTPLNHIIGFADLIRHQHYGALGDKRYTAYADHIKHSGEALLQALTKIIDLADLETGQRCLQSASVHLADLLQEIEKTYRPKAQHKDIQFDVELPDAITLTADAESIQKMICNVLDNALQYTPSGGHVRMTTWMASDGIILEISDTGIGIAADRLTVLNDTFILGADCNNSQYNGRGLGLATARTIAEVSGGQMTINSSLGYGTTVAILLPADVGDLSGKEQYAA